MRSDKMGSRVRNYTRYVYLSRRRFSVKRGTFQQEGLILEEEWNRDIYASCESKRRFYNEGAIDMGVISYVKEEIQVVRERDPAIKSNMEVFYIPVSRQFYITELHINYI